MELVYLWVEDYKNIYKQGFNFSPRFECEYDDIKNELTINENDDYIENFFGDNINVTAIVGKNGSGKSGLSEALLLGLSKYYNLKNNLKIFSICEEDGKYYYNQTATQKYPNFLDKKVEANEKTFILHSNNSLDTFSDELCKNIQDGLGCDFIYDLETTPPQKNFLSFPDKSKSILDLTEINIMSQRMMLEVIYNINEDKLKSFFDKLNKNNTSNIYFIPHSFELKFNFNNTFLKHFKEEKLKKLAKSYYSKIKNNYNSHMNLSQLYILMRFYELFKLNDDNFIKGILCSTLKKVYENFKNLITTLDINNITENNMENLHNYINEFNRIILEKDFGNEKVLLNDKNIKKYFYDIVKTLEYLSYVGYIENTKVDFNNLILITKKSKELLEKLPYFIDMELFTKVDNGSLVSFNSLCYGEKVIIRLFYNLLGYVQNISRKEFKHLIIIFDEIENGLHPYWQKLFMDFLIKIVTFIKEDNSNIESIHFIPITHSPFILSDLPQDNILFIESGKQSKKKLKQQTFGANIHTLLSDGFFMEDGLMGEFAKSKIDNVIKFLNDEKSDIKDKDEAKGIVSIIGEPFLKQKLEQLYHKKYPKSKDEEIAELEKRLEELKNANS